ncbi:uncharacterized protein GGS22DRAFT_162617 [Annulohypoxylon maeteangense]|uniref:uncharacterized protein n=1 Tax=Annulohypoxylon maeteangense TaxID=1927788 RepID=UPI0020082A9D|nr:uncharacterized protein GGS22DRAFT_162617 [Annulohypoxylon maeteangense]KAI0885054.1 hypothetical protein GGS22DRAFT_162617 [Annulohypoxylon maeteangense]
MPKSSNSDSRPSLASPSPSSSGSSIEAIEGGLAYMTGKKRRILDEAAEATMAKRAKLSTADLLGNSSVLISDLGKLGNMIQDLQYMARTFSGRAKEMLGREFADEDDPESHLQRLDGLLCYAEKLSTSSSLAVIKLQSFLGTTEIWGELFERLDRLCLPTDFWEIRARKFLRHKSIPEISDIMFDTFDDILAADEAWAEHFCRLSPKYRGKFISYWVNNTSSWSARSQLNFLESMFQSKNFADFGDYDNRPAVLWANEEAPFYRRQDSDEGLSPSSAFKH